MIIKGKLYSETSIYQGNARKTMFTRDGDGKYKIVSLAGEIAGTAQSLMDAFTGKSSNGKNIGLLERLWKRLYGEDLPDGLIQSVECKLREECYPKDNFFDLRMGIKLDEDRWAAEANANYKMEALFKNSVFDFSMKINDSALKNRDNNDKLYFVLNEIMESRFWFGAAKSKGLGRVRLEADLPFSPKSTPKLHKDANHLRINLSFDSHNPVIVGWNWGKVDPHTPAFLSIESGSLLDNMYEIPPVIRDRLKMSIGGSILNPNDWKQKFTQYFPRSVAIWLKEKSEIEVETWKLSSASLKKMSKGKYAVTSKLIEQLTPLIDKPFLSQQDAESALTEVAGKKAGNMVKRIIKEFTQEKQAQQVLNEDVWLEISNSFGFSDELKAKVSESIGDEAKLTDIILPACLRVQTRLFQQVDQQLKLLQSDSWVDVEIQNREEHLKVKKMLLNGKIDEHQWLDPKRVPEGIRLGAWKDFIKEHSRVSYRHMTNSQNLKKSITNDQNYIEFLISHRDKTRLELSRPEHIDFRAGGYANRHISKLYGKPYDTIFMRMLSWKPSSKENGSWEIYIPGGTIKGAFRKRASQLLKTLWGETKKTALTLDYLFGLQGKRGAVFFSDAYLKNPGDSTNWCSMEGIRIDPKTGQPIETSKMDYLFAYGKNLFFQFQVDIQDISIENLPAVSVFFHLINDLKMGDIPLGGEKTNGFGWVEADISQIVWLASNANSVHNKLFKDVPLIPSGIWQKFEKKGEDAQFLLNAAEPILTNENYTNKIPHSVNAGFISHRAFGGCCGQLFVEAQLLTPMNIKESGEPSYTVDIGGEHVNGYDFYSFSSPEVINRSCEKDREYRLPGRSIKGLIRNIYTIASNASKESIDISKLNAADSLFGWVGNGQNQAVMGRLVFDSAKFENPDLKWFKVPYPYGDWYYDGVKWQNKSGGKALTYIVDDKWRLFPHSPIAPIVQPVETFKPDAVQASYIRAILPKNKARFTIRFWNLEESELQRLLWCIELESGLAHKMGNNKYLGFGSVKFSILPESYLIDWSERYSNKTSPKWSIPIKFNRQDAEKNIQNYASLKKALNAGHI